MKSRRLNNEIRGRICQQLLKSQTIAIDSMKQKLGASIFQLIEHLTPKDVVEFSGKYPLLIMKLRMFFVKEINDRVPVEFYIPGSFNLDDLNRLISMSDNCKGLIERTQSLIKEQKALKNKCLCALEQINTTNQLKEQFPEAYEVCCQILSDSSPKNACDSIENIRVELSKLNKR